MKDKKAKSTDDWLNELVKKYQLPNDDKPKSILTEHQRKIIKSKE